MKKLNHYVVSYSGNCFAQLITTNSAIQGKKILLKELRDAHPKVKFQMIKMSAKKHGTF